MIKIYLKYLKEWFFSSLADSVIKSKPVFTINGLTRVETDMLFHDKVKEEIKCSYDPVIMEIIKDGIIEMMLIDPEIYFIFTKQEKEKLRAKLLEDITEDMINKAVEARL